MQAEAASRFGLIQALDVLGAYGIVISKILICLASFITVAMGLAHLVYTFRGNKLQPVDADTIQQMKTGRLRITNETSVWKAWIGFNASHSMGAILFGTLFSYLSLKHFPVVRESYFLQLVGVTFLGGFVLLARKYWFSVPYRGSLLALVLFNAGVLGVYV